MMNKIKFGTDGWRAKMSEDFTHENVQLVTQALVKYLGEKGLAGRGVAVGYDNRKDSENFARTAAEICSGAGIKTLLTSHSVPSPVISYTVKNNNLGAGIMITASHNPPEWNGFKIKEGFGGSSFPETTKAVEANLKDVLEIKPSGANLKLIDPDQDYLDKLKSLVNIELIKSGNLKIVIDPMFGSGNGYFKKLGIQVTEIRGSRDVNFGGINPEPIALNLKSSIEFIKKGSLDVCVVLDGDADRLAAIDGTGRFINTHNVFCLLLRHLAGNRKMTGEVIKTFNLTNLIDKLCLEYQRKLTVVPIGFKHIAKEMLEKDILLGGEESGGMGIKGFIPERDGVLAGLTLLELMATEKKTLLQILDEIMKKHGYFYYDRLDVKTDKGIELVKQLSVTPPEEYAGMKITKIETLDGLKLNFADESWILFRASGTEPLLRIYAEGRSDEEVKALLEASKSLI
ncbi:MAG: phosphoglucomutase/phosphomannomutase family protein [bacterium]